MTRPLNRLRSLCDPTSRWAGGISVLVGISGGLLAGCEAPAPTPIQPPFLVQQTLIGQAGGTISGPNGARLRVPPGAVPDPAPVALAMPPVGSNPALPPDVATVGATYAVTPFGLRFAAPVTVTVPFDPAQVPTGATTLLMQTSADAPNRWNAVPGAIAAGRFMSARTTEGAAFVVVVVLPPLTRMQTGTHR